MKYDPIKRSLGKVFNKNPFLRKMFYRLLDLLLLRAWYVKKTLRNWKKNIQSDAEILDAGAGFGQYTYFMSRLSKKFKITGIEVKEEQIEDCNNFFAQIKERERIRFEFGDLTKYKKEANFDLILSVDVMDHIEDDVQVFENFHTSLKDNGRLIISTPSHLAEDHDHDRHQDNEGNNFFVDEHVRDGYNPDDIRQKLEKTGFNDIKIKYTYGTPGAIAWTLSMKIPIVVLNISQIFFILLPFYYILVYPFAFLFNWLDTLTEHKKGGGLFVTAKK